MIPFLDLQAQYGAIKEDVDAAVLSILSSSKFVLGDEVYRFEEGFAAYCNSTEAVAVNSGTSALHLALLACGIGPGDEVITTPMTFVATVAAILYTGAKPVFVDIDPNTWTIDVEKIEAAFTCRTKAILPIHLHGLMADMDMIVEVARKHDCVVIEDAAQAHGASYKGRRAGEIGDIGCFSFYPGKNLGAYGEAGAVVTSDSEIAKKIRALRDWGQAEKHVHLLQGFNYRMDAIQGAVLNVKLKHIEAWTDARRRVADRYSERLRVPDVQKPAPQSDRRHVFHVYAVRLANRQAAIASFDRCNIGWGIHYPRPVHLQPAYAALGHKPGDFPMSERVANEFFSLPIYPELTLEKADIVADTLLAAMQTDRCCDERVI